MAEDSTSLEDLKIKLTSKPEIISMKGNETIKSESGESNSNKDPVSPSKTQTPVQLTTPPLIVQKKSSYQTPLMLLLMSYVMFSFPVDVKVPFQVNVILRSLLLVIVFTLSEKLY